MKKVLIFVAGMVTGAILIIALSLFINKMNETGIAQDAEDKAAFYNGFVKGDIIEARSFEVMQVLEDYVALVHKDNDLFTVYLLIGKEGTTFYDGQVIKVPQGSVVRMNGTYKYQTRKGLDKTVPRVMIMDK